LELNWIESVDSLTTTWGALHFRSDFNRLSFKKCLLDFNERSISIAETLVSVNHKYVYQCPIRLLHRIHNYHRGFEPRPRPGKDWGEPIMMIIA